jgi:cell shape-determining protein MreD
MIVTVLQLACMSVQHDVLRSCFVVLRLVYTYVDSFFGLSIIYCPFGIL